MTFAHLGQVLAEVGPLGELFRNEGFRLFLVGGIVRDQLLDEPLDASSDIDLTTDARPDDIKRLVAPFADVLWTQGERFGTIGLRAAGRDYEITTHRAESYTSDSRKPTVSFGDDIGVDLSRRDFTVNAMAIELPDGELVDPYAGAEDLQSGLLRTPLSAQISFSDDPLRMLRAARFAARFDLEPVGEVVDTATELHQRLRIVAIERIGVEIRRLLGLPRAIDGLRFLASTGLLAEVFSYGDPAYLSQVTARQDEAIAAIEGVPPDWHQRLAVIAVGIFDDAEGVQALCQRLRLARDNERLVTRLAQAALGIHAVVGQGVSDDSLRRWFMKSCTNDGVALSAAMAVARAVGDAASVDRFEAELDRLSSTESLGPVSFLDGETIMSALGVPAGPVVGKATKVLRDAYFARGPLTVDEQLAVLSAWAERDQ